MQLKNTNEARVYSQLKSEADHFEKLMNEFPGNSHYFTQFMEAELKCADYSMDNEEVIWEQEDDS